MECLTKTYETSTEICVPGAVPGAVPGVGFKLIHSVLCLPSEFEITYFA